MTASAENRAGSPPVTLRQPHRGQPTLPGSRSARRNQAAAVAVISRGRPGALSAVCVSSAANLVCRAVEAGLACLEIGGIGRN